MPTTRRQAAIAEGTIKPTEQMKTKRKRLTSSTEKGKRKISRKKVEQSRDDVADDGEDGVDEDTQQGSKLDDKFNLKAKEQPLDGEEEPASKKLKMEETEGNQSVYRVGEYHDIGWCVCC
jgi:hypothetical protein